jgi:hypothetical protein
VFREHLSEVFGVLTLVLLKIQVSRCITGCGGEKTFDYKKKLYLISASSDVGVVCTQKIRAGIKLY